MEHKDGQTQHDKLDGKLTWLALSFHPEKLEAVLKFPFGPKYELAIARRGEFIE